MKLNYWHNIEPNTNDKEVVNAVVEIPIGTNLKYEVTIKGDLLTIVRELRKKYKYPFNYGFIPRTYAGDKDPLDAIILGDKPITQLSIVECYIVGGVKTIDNGEQDDKIILIPTYLKISKRKVSKLLGKTMKFLKNYKRPYHKNTTIGKVVDHDEARNLIKLAQDSYKVRFGLSKPSKAINAIQVN